MILILSGKSKSRPILRLSRSPKQELQQSMKKLRRPKQRKIRTL
jgi:hypothetical protein